MFRLGELGWRSWAEAVVHGGRCFSLRGVLEVALAVRGGVVGARAVGTSFLSPVSAIVVAEETGVELLEERLQVEEAGGDDVG